MGENYVVVVSGSSVEAWDDLETAQARAQERLAEGDEVTIEEYPSNSIMSWAVWRYDPEGSSWRRKELR